MPETNEGYTAPKAQPILENLLSELYEDHVPVVMHISHKSQHDDHDGVRPGLPPFLRAVSATSQRDPLKIIQVSLSDYGEPTAQEKSYMEGMGGLVVTLPQILREMPKFEAIKAKHPKLKDLSYEKLMRNHADYVHWFNYLSTHDIALRAGLTDTGITSAEAVEQFIEEKLSKDVVFSAEFVDATIASWIHEKQKKFTGLMVHRDDWPPVNTVRTLEGEHVRATFGHHHGLVVSLERILDMSPRLQQLQFKIWRNIITGHEVYGLHTEEDAERIREIANFLGIPSEERATFVARDLTPGSFLDFKHFEADKTPSVAPFLRKAVEKNRIIAGVVQRLDIIKMDPSLLKALEEMIDPCPSGEYAIKADAEYDDIMKNLRIAMIAKPASFPEDSEMTDVYDGYSKFVASEVKRINAKYREKYKTDEDFILANFDGYQHDKLEEDVYSYFDIGFQLGQEGLCRTVPEALLTRFLAQEEPMPFIGIISGHVGFAEKALNEELANMRIVADPETPSDAARAFMRAAILIQRMREEPDSDFAKRMTYDMKNKVIDMFDRYTDSFYVRMLEALKDRPLRESANVVNPPGESSTVSPRRAQYQRAEEVNIGRSNNRLRGQLFKTS